jgi:hypothetical protein
MSKASDIAAAISARIAQIAIANGYSTDIGTRVFRGRLTLDKEDLPAAILVEDEDRVKEQKRNLIDVSLYQTYIVEGHDVCDPLQPNDKAHLILADIKRAIFGSNDKTLNGLVLEIQYVGRSIGQRPDGTAIVAAAVTFQCHFTENLANP